MVQKRKKNQLLALPKPLLFSLYFFIKLGQIPLFALIKLKSPFYLILSCLIIFLFLAFWLIRSLPSPFLLAPFNRPLTTEIYDRKGHLLYQIYQDKNRKLIHLDNLPPYLIKATITIEDKHFYSHPGVDFFAILRAIHTNLLLDGRAFQGQGASTITQQLVKVALLSPAPTLERKFKEIILSLWTERLYSKEQILEMYFNEIPYGGVIYGIETAAEMYFGKSADTLSLAESAFLAGLPAAPSKYSPYGISQEEGKSRQQEVLKRMVEEGFITKNQAEEAFLAPLNFQPRQVIIKAPHFVMYVKSLLEEKLGKEKLSQGGLKVITSLDLPTQEMVQKTVSSQLEKLASLKVSNGAAMVTDPQEGEILAMVGSKDFFAPQGGNFNAALSLRPPGSSIKVITYSAALGLGFTPNTLLMDTPITFTNPWGKAYSPVNYDGKFHGPVSLRIALASSYNVPAVKVLNIIGLPAMLKMAKEMGITTFSKPEDYGLSLTLGGGDVRLLEMMEVYGTLASGGIRYPLQPVLKITDSAGNLIFEKPKDFGKRVLGQEIAASLTNILSDPRARAPAFGFPSLLDIPGQSVAVKTGTSDQKRDNWTFGYTPHLVVGVWVGNNDNSPMDPKLASGITGAAPIWHEIMSKEFSSF